MGHPQVRLTFPDLSLLPVSYGGVCYGVCFLILGYDVIAVSAYGGSSIWVCTTATL